MSNAAITARSGPSVWHAADLIENRDWIVPWSESELDEIERALRFAQDRVENWHKLSRDDFPLPTVATKLKRVSDQLENGRGLALLTGLPVENYTRNECQFIWMGLGVHIGTPRYQDRHGQLMREICDCGPEVGERHGKLVAGDTEFLSSTARTYSNGVLRFHTDRIDVVGLLSIQQAKSGGHSKVVSAQAVHNAMRLRHPELLEILYAPIFRSRLGEETGGENVIYPLPVFAVRDGKFTSHYSRTYIEAAQLLPDTPRMTEAQWRALDVLAEICAEQCYEMMLEPGDIQLLNNHVIYHAREPFVDAPESGRRRLLLRLWLSVLNSRALPEDHRVLWLDTDAGALRGGIAQGR